MDNLNKLSFKLRKDVVLLIAHSGTGHIGGDMSVMDILVTLYFKHMNIDPSDPDNPDRDRFILSKGHCIEALYMVLAERGFLDKKEIFENYGMFDSDFIGHPNNKISGIEMNTGSLGHGLSIGVGMALASRMDNRNNRVYVVLGDGELEEGSVWEAAMAASCYGLVNICAVVDRNRLQISGSTEDVMALEPLNDKWKSFGWNVISCNGNSCHELDEAFNLAKSCNNKPSVIIAKTIKGFGSSVMENKAVWHHKVPNKEEAELIISELAKKESEII